MKKYLLNVLGFGLLGGLASCGGDDPFPTPMVAFEATTELEVLEIANPIQFINSTTNAATYLWDFGDEATSTDANPEHIYEAPGDYTVVLTATTEDEQFDTLARTITVGQRNFTGVGVASLNFNRDNGDGTFSPWDVGSGPDIIIVVGAEDDADGSQTIGSEIVPDIDQSTFIGLQLTLNEDLPLTDEDWVFSIFEDDSEVEANAFETMIQLTFNPLTLDTSFIDPDTNEGSVRLTIRGYDLFIDFTVR